MFNQHFIEAMLWESEWTLRQWVTADYKENMQAFSDADCMCTMGMV